MPDTGAGALSRDTVRGLARSWWLFLVIGILWILFGMFVLSYNVGSQLALAVVSDTVVERDPCSPRVFIPEQQQPPPLA